MFLINPLEYLFQLEFSRYIFVAFAFFGVMLCVKRLVMRE